MSAKPTDDMADRQREQPEDRYAQLQLDDEFVIYDRENHTAWVQSSVAVSLEDYR
ncbi:DUF7331 family protein [Halorhabdus rudnickae]|uniref:DUF7331 family protein n=1 Tax=Halorhabdus rudnickae TaxID=1775544 RepID=UPI0014383549|nr:hypothetical protein [Halorhabdus rudnickae]